jgi:hypothetical protein
MRDGRRTPRSSHSRIHVTDSVDRLSAPLAGRYHVEREIGAGGMATVYLARDERHDRRVAAKVLRPELAAAIGSSRFLREIKLTANLHHPHILPLCDSGERTEQSFTSCRTWRESRCARLSREKQLPVDEAPWLVATAATVVAIILGIRGRPSDERMAVITTTILPPPGEEFSDRWSFGALSPDGRHFAFITRSSESRSRLWVWAPDDSIVACSHDCHVASVTKAGTRPQVLVTPAAGECLRVSDWTASGNRVIYWTDPYVASRKSEIRSYSIGDGTTESVLAGNSNVSEAVVSPDGRLLAYVSDESGRPEIYLRRYRAAGVSSQVSRAGGRTPRWSDAGRELVFQTPGGEVMSAAVAAGEGELGIHLAQILFRAAGWGRNSFSQHVAPSFAVSGDGRRFYLTRTFVHDAAVLRQSILSLLSSSSPDQK